MAIHWNRRSYTKEQFIDAWNSSCSYAEVARKLGCNLSGAGYHTLRSAAEELDLSHDHIILYGQPKKDGPKRLPKKSLDDILQEGVSYSTHGLKKRLFKEGLKQEKCETCGIIEWMGQKAPLCLDHINGVRTDNRLENLRILCHNCHAQTNTYGSKNKAYQKDRKRLDISECSCGEKKSYGSDVCKNCLVRPKKIDWPPLEEVIEKVRLTNVFQTGKLLGVSDNAVRKFLRSHGVDPKSLR